MTPFQREPTLLVTGFGPFPGTPHNPSRELAFGLERAPPPGARVKALELSVTFRGAPRELEGAIDLERPAAVLALGVQPEAWFRLERRARGRFDTERVDNEGFQAAREPLDLGDDLHNPLDLERLAQSLREGGAPDVRISDDAGGYVCEITNRALLTAVRRHGIPGLFLHVPPLTALALDVQLKCVRPLAGALLEV